MSDIKLGVLLGDEGHRRDAIHIAIAPVMASESLRPGQRVALADPDGKTVRAAKGDSADPGVGVIDPFLSWDLRQGDRCWLCLDPYTIKTLRHEWVHPAFPLDQVHDATAMARMWVEQFALEHTKTYDELMDAARLMANEGDYTFDNSEDYKNADYTKWPQFWKYFELLTGIEAPAEASSGVFTCSC